MKKIKYILFLIPAVLFAACNDYLDIAPPSQIIPEKYLDEESQLAAYAIGRYADILPSHGGGFGTFGFDAGTDDMISPNINNRYLPGEWRVGTEGGAWEFGSIYQMNYFLNNVLPKWKSNQLTGNPENIAHYIGEIYFLRAYIYFGKLQELGDFPILRGTMDDSNPSALIEAAKRAPRNEVARFILSDLDSAITLLKSTSIDGAKQRLSKNVALLLKSRVALFEGTWLKYFKGTSFVPNGQGWPGKTKDFNQNYAYPTGDIDGEIDYFLTQSMDAAAQVADQVELVNNTGIIESANNENPYFSMFGAVNMAGYSEVLLWRQYAESMVTHNVPVYAQFGNYANGLTRGLVESFLMKNGYPIYDPRSGYHGDDYISDVRKDRDGRLQLFLKEPGQKNILINLGAGTHGTPIEPVPNLGESTAERRYISGYTIRKGISYDGYQTINFAGHTGSITFRATEAYLNYIEADYEKNGTIGNKSAIYWKKIRERAQLDQDFQKTIGATQMLKEKRDWGAYSAGNLINPTLYNIRRERRNELMAEGLRLMDLKRWRAMDQLITKADHFEGFKLWGPMKSWYNDDLLVYGADNPKAIVSDPSRSVYLRPHEIRRNMLSYDGVRFTMAHYLSPIAVQHFQLASQDGNINNSVIYQNPGWPIQAGSGAQ